MAVFLGAALAFLALYDPHAPARQVAVLDRPETVRFIADTGEALAAQEGVTLPQDWRTAAPPEARAQPGIVEGHYTIPFPLAGIGPGPHALLIPRVARTAEVFLNGTRISGETPADPEAHWDWYTPILMPIPDGVLQAGDNRLEITVRASFQSTAGLSRLFVGPSAGVAAMYDRLVFLQKRLPPAANLATLILALPLFLIWLHGRRTTAEGPFAIYGLLAASMAIFALRSLHVHAGEAPLPMEVWLALVTGSLAWAVGFFCVFVLRFVDAGSRFAEWGIAAFVTGATLALFLFPNSVFTEFRTLFVYVPMTALGTGCIAVACFQALRAPGRDRILLSLALLLIVPTSIHDVLWVRGLMPFEAILWLPIAMPTVLLAISAIVANRYAAAWVAAHELNRDLAGKVEEAREEIRLSYEERLAAERREGVATERARLVEELHDGVGSRLSLLLTMLETSDLPREESARNVGYCLQDLRTIITARDRETLGDALAELYWLHSSLLDASGVKLTLDCTPEAQAIRLSPTRMLNVLRIAQEALSNAARHSGAARIRIGARLTPERRLEIRIADTGGPNPPPPGARHSSGRGLGTMRARAERLGGKLAVVAADSGWTVVLNMPVEAGSAAVPGPVDEDPPEKAGAA